MTSNKIIAEKINVFLNLLFHLEDYITNQQIREDQLHISDNVKQVLTEVLNSEIVKNYFCKASNIEKSENKIPEDDINYIKKINPQSFNQKNLETLNYFYDSTGETSMIYDILKIKIFTIIKYCLTRVIQKKNMQKEKEIYSKINFALINKNNLSKKGHEHKLEYRSLSNIKDIRNHKKKFISTPNFVIPPGVYQEHFKKKNLPLIKTYNQTGFAKNYKIIRKNSNEQVGEKNIKILNNKDKKKVDIPPSSQLDLINILHVMKKRPIFSDNNKNKNKNKIIFDEKLIHIKNNNRDYKDKNDKKLYLKKQLNKTKNIQLSQEFDYNKVFNMFEALKKRGYIY